jgi:hypothetical protein
MCSKWHIQQAIQDTTAMKFRRLGSSLAGLSSVTLLPRWASNAWVMGAFADDVSASSALGRVVQTMGSATNALPPDMVRTS